MEFITHSTAETAEIGFRLGERCRGGEIFTLSGGLGAGKTALAAGIARGLGVSSRVTSPTFTIVNTYEGRLAMAHFDMYRLKNSDELIDIGWDDYLDSGAVMVIEWSEVAEDILPAGVIRITLAYINDTSRKITIEGDAL